MSETKFDRVIKNHEKNNNQLSPTPVLKYTSFSFDTEEGICPSCKSFSKTICETCGCRWNVCRHCIDHKDRYRVMTPSEPNIISSSPTGVVYLPHDVVWCCGKCGEVVIH
jgi:hypothetical protein